MVTTLHDIVAGWSGSRFCVIDGSQVPGVAGVLHAADLSARSLFLEHRDPSVVAAGPFLAELDERRLDRLLRIPGIERACVFWGGEITEPQLFRHLRSINLAQVPRAVADPSDPFASPVESVLFRHYDPSVLAVVLPVMEPAQRARLFGPMHRLALFTPATGPLEAVARPDWPAPARGWLTMTPAQMDAITAAMAQRSHRAIARYLRDALPEHTAGADDQTLLATIADCARAARGWGIRTEAGMGRFAWLMLATRGRFAEMASAHAYVVQGDALPDRKLRRLMDAMAVHLATGAPQP